MGDEGFQGFFALIGSRERFVEIEDWPVIQRFGSMALHNA